MAPSILFFLLVSSNAFSLEHKAENFLFLGGSDPKDYASKITKRIDCVQVVFRHGKYPKAESIRFSILQDL